MEKELKFMSENALIQEKLNLGEGRYWKGTGKYLETYDQLCEDIVPEKNFPSTDESLLLNSILSIYYDYYNNGFCNIDNYLQKIRNLKDLRIKFGLITPDKFFQKLECISIAYRKEDYYYKKDVDTIDDNFVLDGIVSQFRNKKDFEQEFEIVVNVIIEHLAKDLINIKEKNLYTEGQMELVKEIERLKTGAKILDGIDIKFNSTEEALKFGRENKGNKELIKEMKEKRRDLQDEAFKVLTLAQFYRESFEEME